MSGPTVRGRLVAVTLGVVAGAVATLYMLQDFELVKKVADAPDGERRPFRVSFRPSEPLQLKPEAQERLNKLRTSAAETTEKAQVPPNQDTHK